MPRFTLGSLMVGIVLALTAVYVLNVTGAASIRRAVSVGNVAPPGGPEPLAIDPVTGRVAVGLEKANDYALHDSFDMSGGLEASTW